MDDDALRLYFNRCTTEALEPGDERYVAIDRMEGKPRGLSWTEKIARHLEMAIEPAVLLVTGLRGTGKSTELLKLARRLESRGREPHLVVFIDGSDVLDLANELDVSDVLNAVVYATERKVLEAEGRNPKDALQESYATRLWTWLTKTEIQLKEFSLSIEQQAGLVFEAIAEILGPTHGARLDELIARSGGHPRLLVQMLQWLLLLPEFPATEEDVRRLFAEQRERFQAVVTLKDHPWLQKIKRDKMLTLNDIEHLESIDRALTNNVIFRYANAEVWYDVHPAISPLLGPPTPIPGATPPTDAP